MIFSYAAVVCGRCSLFHNPPIKADLPYSMFAIVYRCFWWVGVLVGVVRRPKKYFDERLQRARVTLTGGCCKGQVNP